MADEKLSVNVTETETATASFKQFVINEVDANEMPATMQTALAAKMVSYVNASAMNDEYASVIDFLENGTWANSFLKTKSINITQNAVANSQFSLSIAGKVGGTQVILLDENGKQIFKSKQTLPNGMQVSLAFDLSKYQSNTYYLKVTNGTEQVTRKITVA
jgi:hypothetical protein